MKLLIAAATFLMLAGLPDIAAAATAHVIDGAARLRAGPGTDYRIRAHIPEGIRVNVIDCLGNRSWCRVSVWDLRGWIHGSRLAFNRKRTDGRPGEVLGEVVDRPGYCYVRDENGNSVIRRCPDGVGADGEPIGGVSGGAAGDHVGRPGEEDAITGGNQGYVRILGVVVDKPGYCYALSHSGKSIIVKCP